jgi:5' nucleotidase family
MDWIYIYAKLQGVHWGSRSSVYSSALFHEPVNLLAYLSLYVVSWRVALLRYLQDENFLLVMFWLIFSDRGMTFLLGRRWIELFDVVITHARKPKFFYDTARYLLHRIFSFLHYPLSFSAKLLGDLFA